MERALESLNGPDRPPAISGGRHFETALHDAVRRGVVEIIEHPAAPSGDGWLADLRFQTPDSPHAIPANRYGIDVDHLECHRPETSSALAEWWERREAKYQQLRSSRLADGHPADDVDGLLTEMRQRDKAWLRGQWRPHIPAEAPTVTIVFTKPTDTDR